MAIAASNFVVVQSRTFKVHVGSTYPSLDTYCLFAAYLGSLLVENPQFRHGNQPLRHRVVNQLSDRHDDGKGPNVALPLLVLVNNWRTTDRDSPLTPPEQVIYFHADNGTHERFHDQRMTDLDLKRVQSVKLNTSYVVCALTSKKLNLSKMVGLNEPYTPGRSSAQRKRSRKVMQEWMFTPASMDTLPRQLVRGLKKNDTGFPISEGIWHHMDAARGL